MKRIMTLVAATACTSMAFAACQLPGYQAEYSLKAGAAKGTVTQRLTLSTPEHYRLEAVTKAHFLFFHDTITETSQGALTKDGFVSRHYSVQDTKSHHPFVLKFSPGKVVATYRKQSQTLTVPSLVYDNLSYQWQLQRNLLLNHAYWHFSVVTADHQHHATVQQYRYRIVNRHAMIDTPMGKLDTIELVRNDSKTKGAKDYFWFAPKFHDVLAQSASKIDGKVKAMATIQSFTPSNSAYCAIS